MQDSEDTLSSPGDSKAVAYAAGKGWSFRTTEDHLVIEDCPICGKDNYHFYMRFSPREKDGVWDCKSCGQSGNLYQLREYLGDRMENVTSIRDVAMTTHKASPIPDIDAAHKALLAEAENPAIENPALEYLLERGFSMEIVEKYKLGLVNEYGKRWITIPYLHKGNCVFVKYRTVPPDSKEFRGLQGREAPLFNADVLTKGMEELLISEGEADSLACLSAGIDYVVGVPGANLKKAAWIKQLDELQPKNIYILYDNDKVGQAAAKEMAARIGIDKVRNICLPEFTYMDGDEEKPGKDINEWFRAGHTLEDFEALKADAKPFDVEGIQSVADVVEEIRDILNERGSLEPKWRASEWASFNKILPGYEPGDLVGVLAPEKIGKSTWAMNVLDFLNREYDEPVLNYCLEMQPARMVRKWMSMVTNTSDSDISLQTVDSALSIAANRKADYLFGYTKSFKRQDVFETIRQAVRRYGVKFTCFDNLQLLCRSMDHFAQEISATTKEFKQLAMELNIVIFLIMQPHQLKDGEIVSSRNVYGSSAPGKDVDSMICLHRNREGNIKEQDFASMGFMEVAENFGPELLTRVDLSRYSAGGVTTLMFDGARSKVNEFSQEQINLKKSLCPVADPLNNVQTRQFEAA